MSTLTIEARGTNDKAGDRDPFILLNTPDSNNVFRNHVVTCETAPEISVCLSVPEYKYSRQREKQLRYLLENPERVVIKDYSLETGVAGFFTGFVTFSVLCLSKVICQ